MVFVEAGDILPPQALATMILAAPGGACLVYSDEDEIDPDGKRQNPYFKSSWNPDLFLSQDYACRLAMVRTADARDKGRGMPGRRAVYDLLLQVTSGLPESTIIRLPHVLYHRRAGLKLSTVESQLMRRSVEEHIRALPRRPGFPAPAVVNVAPGLHHVDWGLPLVPPRVSVIIPTRDRVDLLRTCVDGLRFDTDYPDLEIIIADNGSVEADTLAYLKSLSRDQRVRIISHGGTFNYSAINNAAAHHATGDSIALLNNDLAIHESGWLRDMASHAMRPGASAPWGRCCGTAMARFNMPVSYWVSAASHRIRSNATSPTAKATMGA